MMLEYLVTLVNQVHRDPEVSQGSREDRVSQDSKDHLVILVTRDSLENEDLREQKEIQVGFFHAYSNCLYDVIPVP